MKKFVYVLLLCCFLPVTAQENLSSQVKMYMDEARQGSVSAYERLAECYHRGEGVERSFMNMLIMYSFAADFGGRSVAEYMYRYDENDQDRLLFDAMEAIDRKQYSVAEVKAEILKNLENPGAISVQAILAKRKGETTEKADSLLLLASELGCSFAKINLIVGDEKRLPDSEYEKSLKEIAPEIPIAYNLLGKYYFNKAKENKNSDTMENARVCFEQADKYACLSKKNKELLSCIISGDHSF